MAKQRKPMTTVAKRNWLSFADKATRVGYYGAPLVPVAVMVGINWDEWFVKSHNGWTVGGGFIMLVLSTLLTYFAIAKKKKLFEQFSAFWSVAIILVSWAVALLLLSRLLSDLGFMLLYIAFGVVGSAILDETDTRVLKPKAEFYANLCRDTGLDAKEEKRKAKEAAAKVQAEAEAEARRRAVE